MPVPVPYRAGRRLDGGDRPAELLHGEELPGDRLRGLEVSRREQALDPAELGPQGEEPVGELVLLRAELVRRVRLLDLLDVRLDLVAKWGELRREVLGRGRARRQCLDLVEERADLLGLRLEVRRVGAPIAAASAATAAARSQEKDESARENRPKSSSARQQRAPDCNAHPGQIKSTGGCARCRSQASHRHFRSCRSHAP